MSDSFVTDVGEMDGEETLAPLVEVNDSQLETTPSEVAAATPEKKRRVTKKSLLEEANAVAVAAEPIPTKGKRAKKQVTPEPKAEGTDEKPAKKVGPLPYRELIAQHGDLKKTHNELFTSHQALADENAQLLSAQLAAQEELEVLRARLAAAPESESQFIVETREAICLDTDEEEGEDPAILALNEAVQSYLRKIVIEVVDFSGAMSEIDRSDINQILSRGFAIKLKEEGSQVGTLGFPPEGTNFSVIISKLSNGESVEIIYKVLKSTFTLSLSTIHEQEEGTEISGS